MTYEISDFEIFYYSSSNFRDQHEISLSAIISIVDS